MNICDDYSINAGAVETADAAETWKLRRRDIVGHKGCVIWMTGLSGAGKSTLAKRLERELLQRGILALQLDGDVLRESVCSQLGFSRKDRSENVRRASAIALLAAHAGLAVVVSLVSPFRRDRNAVRARCRAQDVPFAEVFINASLDTCEQRDTKGLYRRAREGDLPLFTGISSPYEPPLRPTLELRTDVDSIECCSGQLVTLAMRLSSLELDRSRGRDRRQSSIGPGRERRVLVA